MRTIADSYIDQGIEKGIQIGISQGISQGIEQSAVNMLRYGDSLEKISRITGLSIEDIQVLAKNM